MMKSANRRSMFAAVMMLMAVAVATVSAQPPAPVSPPGLKALAISPMRTNDALDKSITDSGKRSSLGRVRDAMDSQLTDRFHNTRKFKIVARAELDKVLDEQKLGDSGNCNPADPKVAKAFLLAGAEYVMVFTIDDFQDAVEQLKSETLGVTVTKRTVRFAATGKLWHTTTGELLESMSFPSLETQDILDQRSNVTADSNRSDRLLMQASRAMADRMASRAIDVMYPARVIAISGAQVTINRGDGTDIAPGQVWNVFSLGEVLKDPDTGESLGRQETLVGKVRILSVLPKSSTAQVIEGVNIPKDAVLHLDESRPTPVPATPPAPAPAPVAPPAP